MLKFHVVLNSGIMRVSGHLATHTHVIKALHITIRLYQVEAYERMTQFPNFNCKIFRGIGILKTQ